jgi:hypothetical protein
MIAIRRSIVNDRDQAIHRESGELGVSDAREVRRSARRVIVYCSRRQLLASSIARAAWWTSGWNSRRSRAKPEARVFRPAL